MKEILFGKKNNNVVNLLKRSKTARMLLAVSWIYLYGVLDIGRASGVGLVIELVILGLFLVNLFFIPIRLLQDVHTSHEVKFLFGVCVGMVVFYHGSRIGTWDITFYSILGKVITGICISLGTTFVVDTVVRFLEVHFQNRKIYHTERNFDRMEGHDFEYFCADQLKTRGFHDVNVTRGSGDYGVDVIAWKDGLKYGIQCKRYEGSVGWKAVEEAHAGALYYQCDKAVVLTNSRFTKQAVQGAQRIGVLLWDRSWFEGAR
jgi:restriction system protein